MKVKKYRYYACDFETTVYKNQTHTEVWCSGCVELYTEDVKIFHSIGEILDYFYSLECHVVAYYHNLKFDGGFWIPYLLQEKGYKQAITKLSDKEYDYQWKPERYMDNDTFKYSISDKGMFYTTIIKHNNYFIEIRDSLKLLPFSIKRIGKAFKTKHQKLEMEYEGFRYAGCEITPKEKEYFANDMLVLKEALEITFNEGHKSLTIGACCLKEYKNILKTSLITNLDYDEMFPNMVDFHLDIKKYGYKNADEYIRKSYKGGWTYLVPEKASKIFNIGLTADVNSLYPSQMHSESGNKYPIGYPTFWSGNFIPEEAIGNNKYFFIKISTRFYIKDNMLPFIQIKGNPLYKGTECLKTSDIYDSDKDCYITHYKLSDGSYKDTSVTLTLTMTDYYLFIDHYNLVDFKIISGCWFYAESGIFDEYIDKYKKKKIESKGAKRELAKLFLNNLYGKMATSTDSSFKFAVVKEDGSIGFIPIKENNKKPGYIPCGSAITSYARNFTIRHAQKNYHGPDKPGFIYADTDSIHCDLKPDDLIDIKVHESNFCCWKIESLWNEGYFVRQKTYIEHITHEDLKPIEPYYNIKCAGMPDKCKKLFELSMNAVEKYDEKKYSEEELKFLFYHKLPIRRTLRDFNVGLEVPGKLRPKRIKGGIILADTMYKIR